jgi:hypothetical protein
MHTSMPAVSSLARPRQHGSSCKGIHLQASWRNLRDEILPFDGAPRNSVASQARSS